MENAPPPLRLLTLFLANGPFSSAQTGFLATPWQHFITRRRPRGFPANAVESCDLSVPEHARVPSGEHQRIHSSTELCCAACETTVWKQVEIYQIHTSRDLTQPELKFFSPSVMVFPFGAAACVGTWSHCLCDQRGTNPASHFPRCAKLKLSASGPHEINNRMKASIIALTHLFIKMWARTDAHKGHRSKNGTSSIDWPQPGGGCILYALKHTIAAKCSHFWNSSVQIQYTIPV